MAKVNNISLKLAAALLLQKGELTISDIRALPFVDSEEFAKVIAFSLQNRFNAEWGQRKIQTSGVSHWEDVLLLGIPYENWSNVVTMVVAESMFVQVIL